MADTFTTVTKKGYGQRLAESVMGVFLGIALFFGSFAVLFSNEGRQDLGRIGEDFLPIQHESELGGVLGKGVSFSGEVTTQETLRDSLYLLPGSYLVVERIPEIFAWQENATTHKQEAVGGTETTTTTYTYTTDWVTHQTPTTNFAQPVGHDQGLQQESSERKLAERVVMGSRDLSLADVTLPDFQPLVLSSENITIPDRAVLAGNMLYLRGADPQHPKVGDERVRFLVLPSAMRGTLFAVPSQTSWEPFVKNDIRLYRLFSESREGALALMHGEYQHTLWAFRILGFVMMWMGLGLMLGPLPMLLAFFPFAKNLGGAVVFAVTGAVALVLSAITILISAFLHSIIAIVTVVILVGLGFGGVWYRQRTAK